MAGHQCLRCRSALRQASNIRPTLKTCRRQAYSSTTTTAASAPTTSPANQSTTPSINNSPKPQLDIDALLSKPTWSVRSLLPHTTSTTDPSSAATPSITPRQLHHLLRLSALPQPSSAAEEDTMVRTLETQLHFVRAIQAVDTTGVEPLVTIRDETEQGIREMTIGLEHPRIKEALEAESKVGRMGRVRRRRDGKVEDRRSTEEREWEPLEGAQGRTMGRYFVVESGRVGGGGAKEAGAAVEAPGEKETGGVLPL